MSEPAPSTTPDLSDECLALSLRADQFLALRLGALFAIMLTSALGVALPFFLNVANLGSLLFIMRSFAGGVVVATGFVHILGDAAGGLASPCLGWPDYPWAMMIATFAALITFTLEWHLHQYFQHKASTRLAGQRETARDQDHATCSAGECASHGAVAVPVKPVPTKPGYPAEAAEGARLSASAQACTLEAGIIFHSIFIGISLGLNQDKAAVESLMVALIFHQVNEGLAIGLTFLNAKYSTARYCVLAATFTLTTPIGIAIGIVIGDSSYSATTLLACEGVFNSISAGILLYNGLVDLIVPTFSRVDAHSVAVRNFGFAALFCGAGIMSLIGIWA